jgi:hypothetical protein
VLTFVKCLGFLQDTVYEDTVHLHNYFTNKLILRLNVNLDKSGYLVLCVAALFGSLKMVSCGSKHGGIISATLKFKYVRYYNVNFLS